ncbi:MAG: Na+/H+ antiporter NhaC family protein [Clostridium sp.]|uniref:Na+/H+ antiporter NhaC family protein n=1 Tax=Clostridium sp. TaxID=1506 RepID=UPI003D6DA4B7
MNNDLKPKGNILGILPLVIFLIIYMSMGIFTKSFDNMPLMVAILIASGIGLAFKKPGEKKPTTFSERVDMYCEGGGEKTLILMVIIFMLAGAFYGVANKMHAVDSLTNIGLSILPANMILPGLFIIACLLSFAMGTSMGTVAALTPIAINIATKTGFGLPLVCGIVIGGAMFGDNLSFISDTTIAATRTQGVSMKAKFKANIFMVLPAVVVNLIILAMQNAPNLTLTAVYNYNIVNVIPYVLVIVLSLIGINVIFVMGIGVISGMVIGVIHGDFTFVGSFAVIHEGMTWMEDMSIIAILVGGMVAIMNYLGGIDWLLAKLTKRTKTARGGELSIAALVSIMDIATTNNTISIIATGPIARDIADQFGIARERVASILDLFSSAFNGLLPYAGQMLVAGGLAKISPMSIMPYVWYCMLMIVFGTFFILIGWPKFIVKGKSKSVEGGL